MARQITSRTKRTTASPVYRTRRVVVGMFGLVLLGVAAMGTSLIIKPPGTLPRHGATAQMPYVRRLCPPSAGTSTGAEPRYATSPPTSPCNRHRPYWLSGPAHSRTGHRDDEWCGDGGARVSSTKPVPLSCKSTSVTSTRRQPVCYGWRTSGGPGTRSTAYRPQPADVAVYGIDRSVLIRPGGATNRYS